MRKFHTGIADRGTDSGGTDSGDLPMPCSDLVGVFRPEREEARDHDDGQHGVELRFRSVNRRRELAAEAVELGEKGKQSAHRIRIVGRPLRLGRAT